MDFIGDNGAIIKKRVDEGLTVLSIPHRAAFHQQADQVEGWGKQQGFKASTKYEI
ncbi:MAG: hypothetical protein ACOX55_05250 [Christensenellales bacterium]|jgi:hypothetical protein